jgi:hypothetical protein
MATLLVKDVPDELYTAFSKLAAKKGLTLCSGDSVVYLSLATGQ